MVATSKKMKDSSFFWYTISAVLPFNLLWKIYKLGYIEKSTIRWRYKTEELQAVKVSNFDYLLSVA